MKIYIASFYKTVATEIFLEQFGKYVSSTVDGRGKWVVVFTTRTDEIYRDVEGWIENARGCGLISEGKIDR